MNNPKEESGTGPENIRSLIADLNCDDMIRCQNARRVLVDMGEAAVEPLSKALTSNRQWVRWESAKALGQIGGPRAMQVLLDVLGDKVFEIRWLAAEGLARMGKNVLVPVLETLAKHSDSHLVRQSVHHILRELSTSDIKPILEPVLNAIDGSEPVGEAPRAARIAIEALQRRAQ